MRPLPKPTYPAGAPAPDPEESLTLEAISRAHTARIARWAARLGGPEADVDEVVQDTLLVVARRLKEFRGEAKLTTWLFRITARVSANQRRAVRRRRVWSRLTRKVEEQTAGEALGPGASLEQRERIQRFYRTLDRLPERYRRVLVLFELEELPSTEIAAFLGRPAATVRVQLHRARAAFVEAWRSEREPEEASE